MFDTSHLRIILVGLWMIECGELWGWIETRQFNNEVKGNNHSDLRNTVEIHLIELKEIISNFTDISINPKLWLTHCFLNFSNFEMLLFNSNFKASSLGLNFYLTKLRKKQKSGTLSIIRKKVLLFRGLLFQQRDSWASEFKIIISV